MFHGLAAARIFTGDRVVTLRKPADIREKELRLAIYRIQRGRAHSKATELSISSVAREAGVSPALVHNHYPQIAELIRIKQGAATADRLEAKASELKAEREKNAELRREVLTLKQQLACLATLNEMLTVDNQTLRSAKQGGNVTPLRPSRR